MIKRRKFDSSGKKPNPDQLHSLMLNASSYYCVYKPIKRGISLADQLTDPYACGKK